MNALNREKYQHKLEIYAICIHKNAILYICYTIYAIQKLLQLMPNKFKLCPKVVP